MLTGISSCRPTGEKHRVVGLLLRPSFAFELAHNIIVCVDESKACVGEYSSGGSLRPRFAVELTVRVFLLLFQK